MQIEIVSTEVLGSEDFQPTDAQNIFIKADKSAVLVIEDDAAYKIVTK